MEALFCNLGLMEYQVAYDLQTRLVDQRRQGSMTQDIVLVTEHPRVFTLGRRGGREHLVVTEEFLATRGISVVPIERGGDVTYHGPGQLVVYPIIQLRQAQLSVTEYVSRLEDVMIALAKDCGVVATRDARNHGVWVKGKKLGSVGIAIRHGITFHGLALNVNLSLAPFGWINPCGLMGVEMTSLAREKGIDVSVAEVVERLKGHLETLFPFVCTEIDRDKLPALEVVV